MAEVNVELYDRLMTVTIIENNSIMLSSAIYLSNDFIFSALAPKSNALLVAFQLIMDGYQTHKIFYREPITTCSRYTLSNSIKYHGIWVTLLKLKQSYKPFFCNQLAFIVLGLC